MLCAHRNLDVMADADSSVVSMTHQDDFVTMTSSAEIGHPEQDTLYTSRTIHDSISQNNSITPNENLNTPNVEYVDERNSIDTSGVNQSESGNDTEQQSSTAESNQRIESSEAVTSSDSSDQNQNLQTTTLTSLTTRGSDRGDNQGENMGENICLEEKLRQFQNDNKKDEKEDTRGTYNSSHLSDLEKQRRRNLIFDEERFEETFLKCLICREVYNEYDKLPKMLHCHHTFCMDCLYQMYRVEGEFRQSLTGVFRDRPMTVKIQCPTCREGILISDTELRRLPNDHTIMELLCFVNQTGKQEVQYCTKHQMQPLNFFCEPCVMPVCCDCTVIDHKESKGHVVVNVDEAMEKYTPIVEETLEDINSEKADLALKRNSLDGAQNDLDEIQKDLTNQIRSVFDSIRQRLDDRERELYDIADSEIERKRCVLDSHMKVVVDRENQLDAVYTELERAKTDRDISLIFTGHKTARDTLSKTIEIPLNTTKGFSVTFQFSGRADSSIKQQVGNLGDIIFHS